MTLRPLFIGLLIPLLMAAVIHSAISLGAALVEAVLDENGDNARRRVPVSLIARGSTAR